MRDHKDCMVFKLMFCGKMPDLIKSDKERYRENLGLKPKMSTYKERTAKMKIVQNLFLMKYKRAKIPCKLLCVKATRTFHKT